MRHWSAGLVGLPWQSVRPGPGVRCWTLVSRGLLAGCGISVPDYEGDQASQSELQELRTAREGVGEWPWRTIVGREEPNRYARALELGREFDVAVFRGRGLHAGLMTGRGEMLHIEQDGVSHLTDLRREAGSWRPRFLGLYRHTEMA
jgi:cell wall-associated NlpC family hydrolase